MPTTRFGDDGSGRAGQVVELQEEPVVASGSASLGMMPKVLEIGVKKQKGKRFGHLKTAEG